MFSDKNLVLDSLPIQVAISVNALADLGGAMDARYPGPKILHFHALFGKNWPNNRLVPPGLAPAFWEMLDPPLKWTRTCIVDD